MIGQDHELFAQIVRQVRDLVGDDRGRGAVRLGEDDVEADRGGPGLPQPTHELGHDGPGPRPLPERGQARLIDRHHQHRLVADPARQQALEGVEDLEPERLDRQGVGDAQAQEQRQQDEPGQKHAAAAKAAAAQAAAGRRLRLAAGAGAEAGEKGSQLHDGAFFAGTAAAVQRGLAFLLPKDRAGGRSPVAPSPRSRPRGRCRGRAG